VFANSARSRLGGVEGSFFDGVPFPGKEAAMTDAGNVQVKTYCENVFTDLISTKSKLRMRIRELEQMTGTARNALGWQITHFREIIDMIDWKLDILMKACPYEWTGYTYDLEYSASVPLQEKPPEEEPIPAGYTGG
jgi:hypothetical protein